MTTLEAPPGELTISALGALVGLRPDTIRYYERIGLLPPAGRTSGDHRRYDPGTIDRLRFIQGGQRLGLRLREIKTLLEVRDTGTCPCEPAEGLLRQHVTEIDAEIARLTALRAELVAMVDALPGADCADPSPRADCPDPSPGTWCAPDLPPDVSPR